MAVAKQMLPEQFCSKIREKLKANCKPVSSHGLTSPSSPGHDAERKRGPMVVKYPPEAKLDLRQEQPLDTKENPPPTGKQAPPPPCRSPSPLRPPLRWGKPSLIPRVSSLPSSPNLQECRRQHRAPPSPPPPRPASPRPSRRRSPSPGGRLDTALLETVRQRLKKVRRVRLYLLRQLGPHAFLVAGDSPDHKYKVNIGPQTCSCGKGPHCIHLLFVMLRVFQLGDTDPRLFTKQLKNFEVEELAQQFSRRNRRLLHHPSENSTDNSTESTTPTKRANEDESVNCPICLLEMVEEGESLVSCQAGCRNTFHHHCIAIWAEECYRQKEPIHCPLCRGKNPFPLLDTGWKKCEEPAQAARGQPTQVLPPPKAVSSSSLPRAETLPRDKILELKDWIQVLSQEMVSCLLSRSWTVREAALRQLALEVASVLTHGDQGDRQRRLVEVCCQVLAAVAGDPVYRVYIASLRCLRALLAFSECRQPCDLSLMQALIKPVIREILLKCADGNRRTCQLSIATLVEFAKGQAGALALGSRTRYPAGPEGLGGLNYVLQCVLEPKEGGGKCGWQWWLGRLYVLERLISEFPQEFYLVYLHLYPSSSASSDSGCQECTNKKLLNYHRLSAIIHFVIQVMEHSHPSVSKMSQHVFVLCGRLSAHVPKVFHQLYDVIRPVNKTLQNSLLRKLHAINADLGPSSSTSTSFHRLSQHHKCTKSPSPSRKSSLSGKSHHHHPSPSLSSDRERLLVSQKLVSGDSGHFSGRLAEGRILRSSSYSPSRTRQKSGERPRIGVNRSNSLYSMESLTPLRPNHLSLALHPPSSQVSPSLRSNSKDSLPSSMSSIINFSSEVSTPTTPPSQDLDSVTKLEGSPLSSWKASPIVSPQNDAAAKGEGTTPLIPGLVDSVNKLLEAPLKNRQGTYQEGVHWMKGCLLGTGAFSSCYQVRDLATGTLMAVKQVSYLRSSEDEQRTVMESIQEEIEMMAELRHPNILRLLGATLEGGHYNVFVEWMAGGSVAALLGKYGPFSETVIVRYTQQVLRGLAHLHDAHILHRDLKGANLLVSGDGRTVRIGDFGAAVRLASGDTVAGEFTGQVLGTIAFMAPEVLRGEDYGRACDVWSLGCCMVEMATTRPPWNAADLSNHWALIFKIACARDPPPIPEFLSATTRSLLLSCLETKSDARPSAQELLGHPCFDGLN